MHLNLIVVLLVLTILDCGCGYDRKEKAAEIFKESKVLFSKNKIKPAQKLMYESLKLNPYDPEANLLLAFSLEVYDGEYDLSAKYYKRCKIAIKNNQKMQEFVAYRLAILNDIIDNKIEKLENVIDEMHFAIKTKNNQLFVLRLGGGLLTDDRRIGLKPRKIISEIRQIFTNSELLIIERQIGRNTSKVVVLCKGQNVDKRVVVLTFGLSKTRGDWLLFGVDLKNDRRGV